MVKTKTSHKIQNIVATTSLGKDVPLTKLAKTIPNTEYNPEQFPGLVIRIKDPKTSALIFSSIKIKNGLDTSTTPLRCQVNICIFS